MKRQLSDRTNIMANVGAGPYGLPGWVNLDIGGGTGESSFNFDCRRELPFQDGSVKAIFSEHFVEHIDYTEEAPAFFAECFRSLQPGGVLRIVVPDGERYLRAYSEPGWNALASLRELRENRKDKYFRNEYLSKMELINTVFRQGYQHKWIYDFDNLKWVLERAGFVDVTRSQYGVSRQKELAIDRTDRAHESLYVEAIRPAHSA